MAGPGSKGHQAQRQRINFQLIHAQVLSPEIKTAETKPRRMKALKRLGHTAYV